MKRVYTSGTIASVSGTRDVQTKFGPSQVATAILKDDTGQIDLTLWNENIGKVTTGKSVQIENAFVKSYQGKLQLDLGKYGRIA